MLRVSTRNGGNMKKKKERNAEREKRHLAEQVEAQRAGLLCDDCGTMQMGGYFYVGDLQLCGDCIDTRAASKEGDE